MTAEDFKLLLEFLCPCAPEAELAKMLGTPLPALRRTLDGESPVPEDWQDYLIVCARMRGTFVYWNEEYTALSNALSIETWRKVGEFDRALMTFRERVHGAPGL